MPDAVTVVTVAEPVARRMSAATTQASSRTLKPESCTPLATNSPTPVSTRVCLKPPPAATMTAIIDEASQAVPSLKPDEL